MIRVKQRSERVLTVVWFYLCVVLGRMMDIVESPLGAGNTVLAQNTSTDALPLTAVAAHAGGWSSGVVGMRPDRPMFVTPAGRR